MNFQIFGNNRNIVGKAPEPRFSHANQTRLFGPHQVNLVLIDYASSEGSGEPAHPRSLARTFAARSYKQ